MAKRESMQAARERVFLEVEEMVGSVPPSYCRDLSDDAIVRQMERQLTKVQRAVLMYTLAAEQASQRDRQGLSIERV